MTTWPNTGEDQAGASYRALPPSPNAVLALVLGLLGIIPGVGIFFGVVAFIVSALEREKVYQGIYRPSTALTAAWTLAILSLILFVLQMMACYSLSVFTSFFYLEQSASALG